MTHDTVELLKECNAGIKMAISALDDVLPHISETNLEKLISDSREEHEELQNEVYLLLTKLGESGKNPNPVAKMMEHMKTTFNLTFNEDDRTVSEIIDNGCRMGTDSMRKYLDKYAGAAPEAKEIAGKLIGIEERLSDKLENYL